MFDRIKTIFRLLQSGMGINEISRALDLSRNTVRRYVRMYQQLGIELPCLLSMSDEQLSSIFLESSKQTPSISKREQEFAQLVPELEKRLQQRGMTKAKLHAEYKASHPDGYQIAMFDRLLNRYTHYTKVIGHIEHIAGDQMYVDYAGDKLHIVNPETGEERPVEVFVAILPCSHYTYCEAVYSQQKDDFIRGCENALRFYGGVPRAIVPDNLKAAVIKPSKVEPVINEDFAAFADHYGCFVYPARVRKPQDKALVENAVKLIYRNVYTVIEGKVFTSLESLNAALWEALKAFNEKTMYQRTYSRYERFVNTEKDCLRPLPATCFVLKKRKTITVQANSYVILERHYYSVPREYVGKRVDAVYDNEHIDIYYNLRLITSHERNDTPFGFTKKEAHNLPAHPNDYVSTMTTLYEQAEQIDACVVTYMEHIAEEKGYPAQAYRSCKGILKLGEQYGADMLVAACRQAAEERQYSYNAVERLLRISKLQPISKIEKDNALSSIPTHKNIRGKEYYTKNPSNK